MGRIISQYTTPLSIGNCAVGVGGFLGIFGSGRFKVFYSNGTWTPPADVSIFRVRVIGGGGSGYWYTDTASCRAGYGGGYAHATYVKLAGSYAVTVASAQQMRQLAASSGTSDGYGGTSSFGGLISVAGPTPGTIQQTFQTTGLPTGLILNSDYTCQGGSPPQYGGGGGAGQQLGVLGAGGGGIHTKLNSFPAGSAFTAQPSTTLTDPQAAGQDIFGVRAGVAKPGYGSTSIPSRFPFDVFTGGGGGAGLSGADIDIDLIHGGDGGSGGGGGASGKQIVTGGTIPIRYGNGGDGGIGGGGGYGGRWSISSEAGNSGSGGIGGGGGQPYYVASGACCIGGGAGGQGLVVVEW